MHKILGLVLAGFLGTPAWAQESVLTTTLPARSDLPSRPSTKPYKADLKISLAGRSFQDEIVNARYSRSVIGFNGRADFLDVLSGNLSAAQYFTSGAASNLYGVTEVGAGLNGALVEEASLKLHSEEDASVTAGILKVDLNPVSSIMGQGNWMGASLDGQKALGDLTLSVDGTQATPTSKDTSNRVLDEGTLPLFSTASLKAEQKFGDSGVSLAAAASHFVFTDPSSQAAVDSQKIGSTVLGVGKTADFVYEYRGMEYGVKLKKVFTGLSEISLEASTLRNELSPKNQNTGGQIKASTKYATDVYNLYADLSTFRIESDCLPAAYGPLFYGYTNRIGNGLSMKYEHKKTRIAVYGSYTQAQVLDKDALSAQYQADRDIYAVGAEVKYDLF